jgi:hypothetical protein
MTFDEAQGAISAEWISSVRAKTVACSLAGRQPTMSLIRLLHSPLRKGRAECQLNLKLVHRGFDIADLRHAKVLLNELTN